MTLPVAMSIEGLTIWEAAALNVLLTLSYIVYSYGLHLISDTVRPVQPEGAAHAFRSLNCPVLEFFSVCAEMLGKL